MTKRIVVSASALFIMLALLVGGISKLYETRELIEKEGDTDSPASFMDETESEDNYVLRIEDGVVVVFAQKDTSRPIIVTDIYAGTLRNLDREELTRGIYVQSETALQQLLEDFSS